MWVRVVNWFLFLVGLSIFWYAFKSHFKKYTEFNTSTEGIQRNDSLLVTSKSGRHVLPLNVQLALHVLDSLRTKDYNLYGTFRTTQGEFYQRIQESAWPVRFDTNSRVLIGYNEEVLAVQNVKIIFRHDNFCMGIR